jgi:hypothetical protein
MIDRRADPRTEDRIVFDLLRAERGADAAEVVGRAEFRNGASTVEAPDAIKVAVEELLSRAFVDRVQADERPRGYRRSGRAGVDMLVPGMAEHFIARLRGLWLPYPDGSVVTAREADPTSGAAVTGLAVADAADAAPSVIDAAVRRQSLESADRTAGGRALAAAHPPEVGVRPATALTVPTHGPVSRTDCGWLI